MSKKLVQNEKIASASDRRQRAAILDRGQLENLGGRPPVVDSTHIGGFSENAYRRRDAASLHDDNAGVLLYESEASRRVGQESSRTGTSGNAKNQQRFHLAYEKYYLDELASLEKGLFSKSIIAVEKSIETARRLQRPEKCKEYQRRCSSAGNIASTRTFSISTSAGLVGSSDGRENIRVMPAAVDPAASSKLTSINANFSLPPSPQRSSSSSASDGGSSAFLAMAKRLHRLRVASATSNRNNNEPIMIPKDSTREEFVSIEPLDPKSNLALPVNTNEADLQMPQISTGAVDNQRSSILNMDNLYSQTPSTAPSLSDVSIASFYRLPPAQTQTSDMIGFQRQHSSSSLAKSKIWSSEPVLLADEHLGAVSKNATGQFGTMEKNSTFLANIDGVRGVPQDGNSSSQPLCENQFSARIAALLNMQGHGANGSVTDGDRVQDGRFMETGSWHYSGYQRGPFPPSTSEAYGLHAAADDLAVPNWSRTNAPKDVGSLPAASLPPLPPGKIGSTKMNHAAAELPSSSVNAKTGQAGTSRSQFPDSITRLMDAVSRHPAGELDYPKLKSILRDQRKSYKRRLEREKAKREALEDLLIKLNATPRTQRRSFSNSSSTASTVRNVPVGRQMEENGRMSADLGEVVINSLRSNSIDGNSTNSEDAFLLELIQQHLRMKQALIGHLGKRTTGSSSTSGGEQDHRPQNLNLTHGTNELKSPGHFPDEDDIPMGGEAATGTARLRNGNQEENGGDLFYAAGSIPMNLIKSKSVDYGRTGNELHGLIDKETLKLLLDNNSSTGGSENGRSSSSERRKPRKKWDTNNSSGRKSGKETERGGLGHTARTASTRGQSTARPPVAFFVPAETAKNDDDTQNGLVELTETKPLQTAFCERRLKFIERSISRQDKIKAASELRAEAARRIRELADNVAQGRIRMDEANEQLLVYELPQPSAFNRLEMFRASKLKYEQLPETVARRNKLKRESDFATNRVMAKMFKQKLAYKRLLKKAERQTPSSTVRPSVLSSNDPPKIRLLNA